MSSLFEVEEDGSVLTLRWSLYGRIVAGIYRGIKIFPWLLLIAVVFFLPDYIGGFSDEEPVTGMFWGSIVALVVLGCFLWGVLRVVRRGRWIFDGDERTITAEVKTLWGDPARGEARLRELETLEVITRRWPRSSEVAIIIDSEEAGEEREVLFSGHGMGDEIEEIGQRILDFLKRQRYQVEFKTNDDNQGGDGA